MFTRRKDRECSFVLYFRVPVQIVLFFLMRLRMFADVILMFLCGYVCITLTFLFLASYVACFWCSCVPAVLLFSVRCVCLPSSQSGVLVGDLNC